MAKKVYDLVRADGMWKSYVNKEDDTTKTWTQNWSWLLDEYRELQEKLNEKSKSSKFLSKILEEKKEDNRKTSYFPNSTNHVYGWLASQKNFELECYGSDIFVAMPLPNIYRLIK